MKSIDLVAEPPTTEQLDAERAPLRRRARRAQTIFWALTVGLSLLYGRLYEALPYPGLVLLAGAPIFIFAFWLTHRYEVELAELKPWTVDIRDADQRHDEVVNYIARVQRHCRPLTIREACFLNEYARARQEQEHRRETLTENERRRTR